MTNIHVSRIGSPVGELSVAVRGGRLCALVFGDRPDVMRRLAGVGRVSQDGAAAARAVLDRLRAYFDGDLRALDTIEVAPLWGTDFQRRVWTALRAIPAGTTLSYARLARRIRAPQAVRAVGAANGANPIGVVVPCHRVIASDGGLGGYGGGLPAKRWLLAHEGAVLPRR